MNDKTDYDNEDVINIDCDNVLLNSIIKKYKLKCKEYEPNHKNIKNTFRNFKYNFEGVPMTKKDKLTAGILKLTRLVICLEDSKFYKDQSNTLKAKNYTQETIDTPVGKLVISYLKNKFQYKTYKEKDYILKSKYYNQYLYEYNDVWEL